MSKKEDIDILIVDDEQGVRDSFELILEDHYKLSFATDGVTAFELIAEVRPKLILLDIKMPKMNGLDLLKEIRTAFPNQKVVIVTGYQSVDIAKEAVSLGAADYITKPFESETILRIVKDLLGK